MKTMQVGWDNLRQNDHVAEQPVTYLNTSAVKQELYPTTKVNWYMAWTNMNINY